MDDIETIAEGSKATMFIIVIVSECSKFKYSWSVAFCYILKGIKIIGISIINVQLFSVYLCISFGKAPKQLEYKSVRNFLACFNQSDFNFYLCWYLYLLNNEVRDLVLMVFNDIHSF